MHKRERDYDPMLLNSDIEMQFTERKGKSIPKSSTISPKPGNLLNMHNWGSMQRGFTASGPLSGPRFGARATENDLRRRKIASALGSSTAGLGSYSGDKDDDMYKCGPLGMCNDIHCYNCRADYRAKTTSALMTSGSSPNRWFLTSVLSRFPIVHPNDKKFHWWNKFFVITCLVAIFIDPLFFFIVAADTEKVCLRINVNLAIVLSVIRTVTDFIYLLHILLRSRLAYVARDSRIVGTGDFVTDPKRIAIHYIFSRYFLLDVFAVIPLPQILALGIIRTNFGFSSGTNGKNLLQLAFLFQSIPRICRIVQLVGGVSSNGFIFDSAWVNFVINLLMYILTGHVVGSCWYLLGLQRVDRCLKDFCNKSFQNTSNSSETCKSQLYCGLEKDPQNWTKNATCLNASLGDDNEFPYGIYKQIPLISTEKNLASRYIYSLFWGFQQISTLAGNLEPSSYVWEVLFTMAIIGFGLLLFALLIGNIQNFLQALGRRRLDMQLKQRDVEQWMSHRRLPIPLRNHVKEAERFSWTATRGVNEEELLESLPENIQRDIRRHLFSFLKKVHIFTQVDDDPIFDFVSKRLRQTLYLKDSKIFEKKSPVEKIVFIVRGKVTSIGEDGNESSLSEGDYCGDELLACYLKHTSVNKDGKNKDFFWQGLRSTATVICDTNVEAFCLYAAELENVNTQFTSYLQRPRVQGAIRYQSIYWRKNAATKIQREWRLRMRRLNKLNGSTRRTLEIYH